MVIARSVANTVVAVVTAALLAGCAGSPSERSGPGPGDTRYVPGSGEITLIPVDQRRPAPRVSGETLDGGRLSLTDYRGNVVVVNFWASWCVPCREEAPALQAIYAETRASGVRFVGVDIKDSRENAKAFVRRYKITYPSWYDQPGRIALAFREVPPRAVPSTIVVDRNGRVAAAVIGSVTYSRLKKLVTRLAAERP